MSVIPRLKVTVVENRAMNWTPKNQEAKYLWKIYDLNTPDKTSKQAGPSILAQGVAGTFTEAICFAGNEAARLHPNPPPAGYLYLYARDPDLATGGIPF